MRAFCVAALFLLSSLARATDSGDVLLHGVGSWNQDLEVFQLRGQIGYAFWNDFSLSAVLERNDYYIAPALGLSWHLEPFEVLLHTGPLFWRKDNERRSSFQVSVYAHYLIALSTHFQCLVSAGANFPETFFRGVPVGGGLRYWF